MNNTSSSDDPLLNGRSTWDDDDVEEIDFDDDDDDINLSLRIKESNLSSDVVVEVPKTVAVADVKKTVRSALGPSAEGRYMRLIFKGRLLAPDTAPIKDFSLGDGDVLHAVLAAAGVRGGQQAALARGTTRRFRGTGVGANGRIENSALDEEEDSDEEDGRERLGFDRLRASGLSRQEISTIRTYFSRQVDRWLQAPQNANLFADEPDALRRRYLQEDAWMQAQGPASEFRLNLNQSSSQILRFANSAAGAGAAGNNPAFFRASVGTDRDFLWGFLLGFFVGFLMLVWVWLPTVPHKQKLGILTGISLQLALSLLKASDETDDELADETFLGN